jgi:PAS domain S-box-containing protein
MSNLRATNRLTVILPFSVALMGAALAMGILLYWQFSIIPSITTSERAKAEVIMIYATHMVEASLNENDPKATERAVKRLMLMTDPVTGKKLYLGIDVLTVDGKTHSERNDPEASSLFRVSAPFYSESTQDLRGEITIVYNDYLYKLLVGDARKNLVYALLLIAAGAFGFYLMVRALLRPLASLSQGLSSVNLAGLASLPPVTGYVTGEIGQLATAMQDLLKRLDVVRKSEREKDERLQAIMDYTSAVIYVKDIDGRYLTVNRQFEKLFGVTAETVAGKTDNDLFPKEASDAFRANDLQVITTGEPLELEESVPQADGVHTYIAVKFPLKRANGEIYAVCGISTDISERKAAEEILRDSHTKLEAMVAERTAELANANRRLEDELEERRVIAEGLRESRVQIEESKAQAEAATLLKNKFISLVSHDLRSPLSSIIWAMEMLLMSGDKTMDEEKKSKILASVRTTSLGLVTLINKLLDISGLHTGQIVPSRSVMKPRMLVGECASALENMAERKQITVVNEIQDSMMIYVDHDLFREVIANLLTNAIKFTPSGGKVTVWSPDGGKRMISVTNNGMGVPPAIIGNLFRHEVKTTTLGTAGERGTGLGLPYCKDVMSVHKGDICVESVEGKGATFTVSLPPIKVVALIVDDQEAQRGVIRDILIDAEGIALIEATNGHHALEVISVTPPGILITDLNMPDMDGFTLIERMRENGRFAATPVIVVSAFVQVGEVSRELALQRANELGVARVLAKPVVGEDLLAAIWELVKG